jgi:uncharacterized repeat protein (TIGR01451 family)/fimbrial isopeptide formation D2 family protein
MREIHGTRAARLRCVLFALASVLFAGQAAAQLTVTPITWDVVGLDSNRPLTSGPELFPVGAEVCAVGAPSAGPITVDFFWPDGNNGADPYINTRPGSLTTLDFAALNAGECVDAYFELQLTRSASAFGNSREYYIEATDLTDTVTTPRPRQIYIEYLVSQNRNTTTQIRYGQQEDQSDWQTLGNGGSINLLIGETYFIELTTATATGYEELESFLTLSNTIFQVLEVRTTYTTLTDTDGRVQTPTHPQLWADGCLWDSDPDSPNYLSCLSDGKAGGTVVTVYEIRIISGGGDQVGLEALIYDRSGGSFHYNTDFSQSPGDLTTVDPAANAAFAKRFIPDTIGADGISTLRLTITNPNPVPVSGYSFTDDLPSTGVSQMEVAATPNVTNTCGGTVTANVGSTTVSLTDGTLAANSSCTILVDVTVPGVIGETYPLALLNSVDLYVGAAATPSATATATLNVTAEPPPPEQCSTIPAGTSVAEWTSFTAANNPNHPPTGPVGGLGVTTSAGIGITTSVDAANRWVGEVLDDDTVVGDLLANARSLGQYYEFVVETSGLDQVSLSFVVSRQNGNGPASVGLDYGPEGGTLTLGAQTWTGVSTNAGTPSTFSVSNLTNLNSTGNTVFRFYIYNAVNPNIAFRVHQMNFTGSGTLCTPFPPGSEPDPPAISKTFSSSPVRVGEVSTLTFTLTNPNTDPADDLTGVTFRDELPSGMTVVSGSLDTLTCGGTWVLDSTGPDVVLLTGVSLAENSSCQVSVQVISTTVGDNVNVSDPVDATETYPGNSAVDTLTVLPPPTTPTIAKYFDPNPLLDPTGATDTTLLFEITNTDPLLDISGVAFADTLPSGMSFVTGTIVGDCGGGTTTISTTTDTNDTFNLVNGAITANSSCTIEVDVAISAVDVSVDPVTFDNQSGLVSHVFNGITYTGNDAEATLVVDNPIPGVALLKEVGLGSDPDGAWSNYLAVEVGTGVYYKITLENIGETTLTGIAVSDISVDTSSCTWPGSLPVADGADPLAHIAVCVVGPVTAVAGTSTNTAGVVTDEVPGPTTDSAAYATVELTLDKSASPLTYTAAGQTITYTFTVTNAGSATLPGPVTISDALVPGASCPDLTTIGNGDNFFNPAEEIGCTGSYTIQAADVTAGSVTNTATASVAGFDSPEDSETVFVPVPPTIAKSFGSDPVAVGATSDLTITVTNNAVIALSGVAYSDQLPAGLSFVTGTISGNCGGGTTGISTTSNTNDTFSLSGGAIAASGSCAITVTVSADAAGSYTNTTSVVSSTEVNGTTTGSDTLEVTIAEPTIAKSFADALIGTGGTTTLTITATNAAATALSNVAYSDQLPAGLSFIGGTIVGDCGGGTAAISTTTNTNDTFSLSGGAIAASGSCAITVGVSGDVEGSYTNTTSVVTSDEVDGTTTGSDDLEVEDLPTIAKSFDDATVATGATTTLTITVTNNAAATTLTGVGFTDQLPVTAAGELEYVAPVGGTCSALTGFSGVISDNIATADLLTVSGFDLAAGASCTVTVDVQGNAEGDYTNTTSVVSSTELTGTGTGTDDVEVGDLPTIEKSFTTDPINVGGTSVLTITATNNAPFDLTGVSFSDQLPVGLAYSGTATTDTCGGTTSINAGTRTLSVSGGSITADSSCTITIAVQGLAGGIFNNVTSVVDSTELTGTDTGSDGLVVNVPAPTIAKSFGSDPVAVGATSDLTITVTNNAVIALSGVAYSDQLPAGLSFVTGTISGNCGGGTTGISTTSNTNDTFSLSGGAIAASGSCAITVTVSADAAGSYTNTTSVVSSTEVNGTTTGSDTLEVTIAEPTIAKSFADALIGTGGTTTLTITATNAAATALSNVAYSDQLPAGLSFIGGTIVGDCGGGTAAISTTTNTNDTLTLSGGAIAASGSCAITVGVSGDVEGSYTNTTSVVTSDEVDGTTTGSDDLEVEDLPTIAKSFDDATVATGATTTLTITVTNNAAATTLTGVGFTDQLPVTAAGELEYVAPVGGTCSALTGFSGVISDNIATADLLTVSGFDLAAGASCTVTVDVQGNAEGDYTNTTSVVSSTELTGTGTGTDDVEVGDLPTIEKSFATDPINVGGTSVLTITATNNAPFDLTGVSFSDQLPVGLAYSGTATTDTCGGTTSINAGTRTLSVSGGSITADSSCTITIAVQGLAGGIFNNVTSVVDSTELTGTDTGSDGLVVNVPAPTIAKSFGSDPVAVGATSDLTITVTNNAVIALSGVAYSDQLPAGLSFVTGTISGNCGGGTTGISTTSNTNDTFSLSGGAIAASGSCAITVTVSADAAGSYTNTTSVVSSTEINGTTTGSDTLDVTIAGPTIAKSFADALIGTGGTTTLTITATNAAATALSNVAYSDQLPAGLSFIGGTIVGDCGGGTAAISTTTNTNDTFSLSGGAIAASGSCAITVGVSGDVEGSYTNTTSVVTSDEVDGTTTGSDDLEVEDLPTIAKSFDDATVATGATTTLTITVTNNAAATTLTGVGFTDQLPVTAAGELEYVAPVGGTCSALTGFSGVISDNIATADLLTVSGFDLAAGASCTVTVDVQGNAEGDFTNTTSVVSSTELTGTGTGTDDVEVGDLPTIEKSFTTDPINVGGTSVLTITATNNAPFDLTGVSFSDQLPVGLAYSGTATTDTCGGTTSINAGTRTLSVSGGSITADSSCTITIAVQGLAGGIYNNVTSVVDSTELTGTDTGSDGLVVNVPAATIAIAKTQTSGPSPATAADQVLGYTIVVTNTGAVDQTGVTVTDTLPDGSAGTLTGPTESITTNSILEIGETWTYTTSYTVTQADIEDGSDLVNTASVVTTEVPGPTTDTATTSVTQTAVTVTANKVSFPADGTPIALGATIAYTLTLEINNGPTSADTVLTDTLGAGLTFGTVTSNPGGFILGGTGNDRTFTLSSGAASGTYVLDYTAVVNMDATGGTVNNSLFVTGGGDPDPVCTSCSTGHPLTGEIQAIPTASTWGLLLLAAMIALAACWMLGRGGF